jgi:hypothetical protein
MKTLEATNVNRLLIEDINGSDFLIQIDGATYKIGPKRGARGRPHTNVMSEVTTAGETTADAPQDEADSIPAEA